MRFTLSVVLCGCMCASAAQAQSNAELLQRLQVMEERLRTVEAELSRLKGEAPAAPAQAPSPPVVDTSAAALQNPASQAGAAKAFNPDMAVIGNFLGAVGNGGPNPSPAALEMAESEVSLQSIIDPYARADIFLSFGEKGVDLEEGYLTFPALKGGFQLRAGKMRAAFGRVNTFHSHILPWADRPLMTKNLVGGEEGISDAGLSLSRLIPAPGGLFLEGTAQLFRGDSEGVFQSYRRSNVSTVEHLRAYRDLSESTNLDLGVSYARGHSPVAEKVINQLYGVDATIRWKPLRRSIYNSFAGRTELIWSPPDSTFGGKTPFGYYVSGDYQLNRRWFAGARFDRSERSGDASLRDTGGSLVLTYKPSEFSLIRGQLRRTQYAENMTANELLFQVQFAIGAHGAHPF